MCKWRSALNPDYHCRVSPEPGSDYCIFHEPGKKDVQRFKQKFYEQIDGDGPEEARNPRYDFRGYFFPTGIVAGGGSREAGKLILPKEIAGDLISTEATIKGDANFRDAAITGDANFRNATIEGDANFGHATIEGNAYFRRATIEGNASFINATIEGDADFSGATIEGDAHFGHATIEGDADFRDATIKGDAHFRWHATIGGDAHFSDATIGGNASFVNATIGGDADFWLATIVGNAHFGHATIGGDAHFRDATIGGNAHFRGTRLRRTVYFEGASIGGKTEFALCQAEALSLGDRRPTILLWWVRWRCGIRLHDVETSGSFWSFARLTFERQGEREKADAAHYLERLVRVSPRRVPFAGRWWNRVYQTLRRSRIVLFPWFFDCLFLRWPTAYGASLLRLFVTWAVIIGGFAGVYTKLILKGFSVLEAPGVLGLGQAITSFWGALYFSVITFTTLGYGDIRPTAGLPSGLAAAEAVLGGIMMALTVLVIGRKFMR